MIILASASPRRIEMLKNAGYDPVVKPASIIESLPFEMKPETATMYLALSKAFAVAEEITAGAAHSSDWPPRDEDITIIAADTVVVHEGEIIGKPADEKEAFQILSRLKAASHHVITGCCICSFHTPASDSGCPSGISDAGASDTVPVRASCCFHEDTKVFFKNYSTEELRNYVSTDEPYDKAGGYAIQGTFEKYIDHIEGDYDNVVGLPLYRIKQYL